MKADASSPSPDARSRPTKNGRKIFELARDCDLFEISCTVQFASGKRSNTRAELRDPSRRPNGLYFRFLRRISQCHRRARGMGLHRCAGRARLARFRNRRWSTSIPTRPGPKPTERTLGLLIEEEFGHSRVDPRILESPFMCAGAKTLRRGSERIRNNILIT